MGPRYFAFGIASPGLYTLLGVFGFFSFLDDFEVVWVRSAPSSLMDDLPKARFIFARKGMTGGWWGTASERRAE